jgi:hypothetical protein
MRMVFYTFCIFYPLLVFGDMYDCNGVWTNRPCDAPARVREKQNRATPTPTRAPMKEISAQDILGEVTIAPTVEPTRVKNASADSNMKQFFVTSILTMNRSCNSYFNRGQLKKFERNCLKAETSVQQCQDTWSAMHAEMLGKARDDTCRNTIFNSTNELNNF